mmetsp:Transcript_43922/g.76514  ORF Transcript_43922/g.76514 Transcript_43922/m.76514 type:complete len:1009 (+) Transcript_43922:68-3094(+)
MMQQEKKDLRTIPWCAMCLTIGALICHTLVLVGNLATAKTFSTIGDSTSGWSNVGWSLSRSMDAELDSTMSSTVTMLTDALEVVVLLSTAINDVLGVSANSTDDAVNMLQSPKMRTHPVIFAETNDTMLTIPGSFMKDAPKKPFKTVSMLSFSEIPHDGKLQIHNEVACLQTDKKASDGKKGEVLTWTPDTSLAVNVRTIKETLKLEVVRRVEDDVVALAHKFLDAMKPPLEQVGKWLHSMGDKMMGVIEQFSMTIDKVQKIFDQIMKQIAGPPEGKEDVVYNTYTLFDLDNSGEVTLDNLIEVGSMYGITALSANKCQVLLERYDYDNSGTLNSDEYSDMIDDPDIPSAGTYVLRQYAKGLAQIGGNLAAAVKRDEIAATVVSYLTYMGVKNLTKISWVCERLTNGSLVMDVTANVYKKMAENTEDPVQLTTIDVPQMVTDEMFHLNQGYALDAFELMTDPEWWELQGFDSYKQPKFCQIMSEWIAKSPYAPADFSYDGLAGLQKKNTTSLYVQILKKNGVQLNQVNSSLETRDAAKFAESIGKEVYNEVYKKGRRHQGKQHRKKMAFHNSIFAAKSSPRIFKSLLGTASLLSAGAAVPDADVQEALNSGVDALPETLEFAKFLSWNATQTAKRFDGYAFDYAQTSSNAMESFADQVKGMVNAVSGFLNTMMDYSTPRGIQDLEDSIMTFVEQAAAEADSVVDKLVDDAAAEMFSTSEMVQIRAAQGRNASEVVDEVESAALTAFSAVAGLMDKLTSILPTVINDLSFARIQVSAVAEVLETVFTNFAEKGSPIFQLVASLYKTLWTVYFVFFALITLLILFYGFWATGWLGGPAQVEDEGPPAATSCKERCLRCVRACNWCMHNVHNSHLCFWSCILLSEVVVLVMFIVGIILCVLAGVKAFLNVGCAQVYVLGDDTVCLSTLFNLKKWLATFWDGKSSTVDTACDTETLTACKKIMALAMQSLVFTTGGSFAAAIFSFQMLFESASLHEKARWLYLTDMAMMENK